jgi:hypothetical protein
MSKFLSAMVFVLSCSAANAGSLCPYDTPACRMMPDRYVAPQVPQVDVFRGPIYTNPPMFQFEQLLPNGHYGRSPMINPDGSYRR